MSVFAADSLESLEQEADKLLTLISAQAPAAKLKPVCTRVFELAVNLHRENPSTFNAFLRVGPQYQTFKAAIDDTQALVACQEMLVLAQSIIIFESLCREQQFSLFGKVTLMRHGITDYKMQGLDLTAEGVLETLSKRELVHEMIDAQHEVLLLASSPAARARGTMHVLFPDQEARISELATFISGANTQKAQQWVAQNIIIPGQSAKQRIKRGDTLYAQGKFPEEIFGPREETENRFFLAFEVVLRYFSRIRRKRGMIPDLFVVTHFEFIHHFINSLFTMSSDNSINPSEYVEITILMQQDQLAERYVALLVRFRNQLARAYFDRKDRRVLAWTDRPMNG